MKGIGSGSDGGVHSTPGTWAATNVLKKQKKKQGRLDSGLLPEGHFLGPRIGRTVYFLDFSDFLSKNAFLEMIIFLEARCSPGPRFGGAFYLSTFPNFDKLRFWKSNL